MNPTNVEQDVMSLQTQPGAFLALEREKKGITIEQVASKLNLRVQVIGHLEADEYQHLPEPVFIQGYIRAYCKFLGIPADEVIESYLRVKPQETKFERGLWQNKEPSFKNESWLSWLTGTFLVVAVGSASMWFYENKSTESIVPNQWRQASSSQVNTQPVVTTTVAPVAVPKPTKKVDVKLTDLSKMRQLLTSSSRDANFSPKEME